MKQLKKILIVLYILCLSVFYGDYAYAHARHPSQDAYSATRKARGIPPNHP
ncbi:MAG: hypothetical protein F6K63_30025 [Moorea sp. SIO1G6]|uniref:hypothetical protein n=1 Tax=unclassified Moorena TaxID=2683338 RepID=UPI0013B5E44E|nr:MULTISPECIES: hypothetical protein [unclassified Moorena]NEQ11487.1 hypothetical protein [Moorena sp. SIO4E2]NET68408.1 hypothetical protein [Moorena sp. SIO1G6]